MKLSRTDKVTLAGLYLSKFNDVALAALGCKGFGQAFNIIGYSLEASPASVKNYRDEFDHEIGKNVKSHPRKGWDRPLKTRSQRLYEQFASTTFDDFTELIKNFLVPSLETEKLIAHATKQTLNMNLAQRLMTGQAAEAYFKIHHSAVNAFAGYTVEDVTSYGCGYDFHLSYQSAFYCVEVKGIGTNNGTILMTAKEHALANRLKNQYCLFIVRGFQKIPFHSVFFNPLNSGLSFTPQPKTTISYSAYVTEASCAN